MYKSFRIIVDSYIDRFLERSVGGARETLTVSGGKRVSFFDAADLSALKSFDYPFALNSAALNEKTNRFVAGGEDFWAKVFDYHSGDVLEVHKGHHGPVHCVRYSPDLELFASSSGKLSECLAVCVIDVDVL